MSKFALNLLPLSNAMLKNLRNNGIDTVEAVANLTTDQLTEKANPKGTLKWKQSAQGVLNVATQLAEVPPVRVVRTTTIEKAPSGTILTSSDDAEPALDADIEVLEAYFNAHLAHVKTNAMTPNQLAITTTVSEYAAERAAASKALAKSADREQAQQEIEGYAQRIANAAFLSAKMADEQKALKREQEVKNGIKITIEGYGVTQEMSLPIVLERLGVHSKTKPNAMSTDAKKFVQSVQKLLVASNKADTRAINNTNRQGGRNYGIRNTWQAKLSYLKLNDKNDAKKVKASQSENS